MVLEKIIDAVKWTDRQILRQYAKLARRTRKDPNALANAANLLSISSVLVPMAVELPRAVEAIKSYDASKSEAPITIFHVIDISYFGLWLQDNQYIKQLYVNGNPIDRFGKIARHVQRAARLPAHGPNWILCLQGRPKPHGSSIRSAHCGKCRQVFVDQCGRSVLARVIYVS